MSPATACGVTSDTTVAIGKIVMAARPTVYVVMAHEGDIFRCSLRYAG